MNPLIPNVKSVCLKADCEWSSCFCWLLQASGFVSWAAAWCLWSSDCCCLSCLPTQYLFGYTRRWLHSLIAWKNTLQDTFPAELVDSSACFCGQAGTKTTARKEVRGEPEWRRREEVGAHTVWPVWLYHVNVLWWQVAWISLFSHCTVVWVEIWKLKAIK